MTQEAEIIEDESNSELMPMVRKDAGSILTAAQQKMATPQELRTSEVSDALAPAYLKAATLEMTEAEIAALTAPFPDELVEIRPNDGLIFIPHIHVRNRLSQVFKPGKWTTICRRHWLEGGTMYGEYVMIIRGCFVGESVGGHQYLPNNPKTNYSDALESAEAEAIRRIAGKKLGCGSQVWEPEYCRQWCAKHSTKENGKYVRQFGGQEAPQSSANAPQRHNNPVEAQLSSSAQQNAPKSNSATPTPKDRLWMIEKLQANPGSPSRELVTNYFIAAEALDKGKELEELPLEFVAMNESQIRLVASCITGYDSGERAALGFPPHDSPKAAPQAKPAPKKAINMSVSSVTGIIAAVSLKEGESARGKWSRYGVKVNDVWYSTFDKVLGAAAQANKGQEATIQYAEGKLGNDMVDLLFGGVSVKDMP